MKVSLTVLEGNAKGQLFELEGADRFVVGRSNDSHLRITGDDSISRIHFLMEVCPPVCHILDKSANGTFVKSRNEAEFRSVKEAEITDGDLIKIGRTVIRIDIKQEPVPIEPFYCIRCRSEITESVSRLSLAELTLLDFICSQCLQKEKLIKPQPLRYECYKCAVDLSQSAVRDGRAEELKEFVYLCDRCARMEEVLSENIKSYRLIRELGKGGMGIVYQVLHKPTQRVAALKKMLTKVRISVESSKRFQREVAVMSELKHSNIVRLADQGMSGMDFYFVTEYMADGDCSSLVNNVYNGPVPLKEASSIICDVLEGLEYAHRLGFIHRDIKPPNILLTRTKQSARIVAKLADFGLAKNFEQAGNSSLTKTGDAAGTLYYMAPEQMINYRYVKPTADLYSVGVTFYYLLTTHLPLDSRGVVVQDPLLLAFEDRRVPIREYNPSLPPGIASVIDKSVMKNALDRFQTAAEFKEAIQQATR